MKVEELMTGDWYWWEAEGKKYPLQVTKDTFKLMDEDISNFQPIPITKEILEKNGFEGIKEGRFPSLRNHYNDIIFQLERIEEERYCKILYIFKNIPICYVHELQHALKLCKINKEIIV